MAQYVLVFEIHLLFSSCIATNWMQVAVFSGFTEVCHHVIQVNCIKSVGFIKLNQICENQTCCNLIFADLLQVAETTCITLVLTINLQLKQ